MKKILKSIMPSIIVILLISLIITFYPDDIPMNQEQVTDCFEKNFESLAVVAEYLINHEHDGITHHMLANFEQILLINPSGPPHERVDITDEQVVSAIISLKKAGYRRIDANSNRVRFERDGRGERSSHGWLRTGVFFSAKELEHTGIFGGYGNASLSEPNWYFYVEHRRGG